MRPVENGVITDDDVLVLLVRHDDGMRVAAVGPYRGVKGAKRANGDADAWQRQHGARTLLCRMIAPADMEEAFDSEDVTAALVGYAANMRREHHQFLEDK